VKECYIRHVTLFSCIFLNFNMPPLHHGVKIVSLVIDHGNHNFAVGISTDNSLKSFLDAGFGKRKR